MNLRNLCIKFLMVVSAVGIYAPMSMAEERSAVLEEIIVTASRRAASIQDSSLVVEALTGDQLAEQGITNLVDLGMLVPSLQVGAAGPALQMYIRGVGNSTATSFGSPAIAVSKDGAYIARAPSIASHFYDIQRVEVLKGPQGTLYGRNATGGAVNIITNAPEIGDEVTGYVSADAGDYSKFKVEGAVNIPLSENAAARLSLVSVDRDGYMSDDNSDDEHWSARLQTVWESDNMSWKIQAQYAEYDGRGPGFTWAGSPDAWEGLYPGANAVLAANAPTAPSFVFPWITTAPVLAPGPTPPFPPGTNIISLVDFIEDDIEQDMTFWDISTTLEWDLEFATLTVLTAYQESEVSYISRPAVRLRLANELDGNSPEEADSLSFEVRLNGDTDKLQWVAGVNVFSEEQIILNRVDQGVIQNLQIVTDYETDALGVFGELTYSVNDRFRLIGGLRYSDDEQKKPNFFRYAINESLACPPPLQQVIGGVVACVTSGPESEEIDGDSVDWKVGFEYDISDDVMLFANASTGYKSGGLPAVSGPGFEEEELTAISVGMKSTLMDGRMQLNGDIFYWDYEGRQEAVVAPDATGIVGLNTFNAGDSTISGIAFDMQFAASDKDFLRLNFEYLDAEYDDFTYEQAAAFTPPTTCQTSLTGDIVPTPGGPSPELLIDCSGFEMTKSPEISLSAEYTHTFVLGNVGELDARVNVSYTDERWLSANFLAEQRAGDYTIWNLYLTYRSSDDRLSATAYLENASEEESYHASLNHTQVSELVGLAPGAPRVYGLRLRYDF